MTCLFCSQFGGGYGDPPILTAQPIRAVSPSLTDVLSDGRKAKKSNDLAMSGVCSTERIVLKSGSKKRPPKHRGAKSKGRRTGQTTPTRANRGRANWPKPKVLGQFGGVLRGWAASSGTVGVEWTVLLNKPESCVKWGGGWAWLK